MTEWLNLKGCDGDAPWLAQTEGHRFGHVLRFEHFQHGLFLPLFIWWFSLFQWGSAP